MILPVVDVAVNMPWFFKQFDRILPLLPKVRAAPVAFSEMVGYKSQWCYDNEVCNTPPMLSYRLTGGVLDCVQNHRFETYTMSFSVLVEAMREFVGNERRLLVHGIARGD